MHGLVGSPPSPMQVHMHHAVPINKYDRVHLLHSKLEPAEKTGHPPKEPIKTQRADPLLGALLPQSAERIRFGMTKSLFVHQNSSQGVSDGFTHLDLMHDSTPVNMT